MKKANNTHTKILTVPNLLSLARILLIPVFILLMVRQQLFLAFIAFILAALTDFLDGIAARIWKQKTKLGAYLDPAADKLFTASSFIVFSLPAVSYPNTIPIWLVSAVIARDVYIVSGTFTLISLTGKTDITPSLLGKACTVLEMGVLVLVFLFNVIGKILSFLQPISYLTLVVIVLSAAHYTAIGLRSYTRSRKNKS